MTQLSVALFAGVLSMEVAQNILIVEAANQSPIYAMAAARGNVRPTRAVEFKWGTTTLGGRRTQIDNGGAAYDGTTTSVVVDDVTPFKINDLVVCEATGEVILINAINTGTKTLTIQRGIGSTAGAAGSVANNAWLQLIGNVSGEGAPVGNGSHVGADLNSNVVQLFREPVEITGTMARVSTETEPERPRQRAAKFEKFVQNLERTFIHGQKSTTKSDVANRLARTTGGLREAITTHVTSGIGTLTEDSLYAALEGCFSYGSGAKTLYAGPTLILAVNKIFRGRSRTTNPDAPVGMKVERIMVPWGQLDMVPHRGLTGGFAGDGIVLEDSQIAIRPTAGGAAGGGGFPQNGQLQLRENIQAPGSDAAIDEWFMEGGLEWGVEEMHAQLKGVTGATTS